MASIPSASVPRSLAVPRVVVRHSALVRVCHWVNALCFLILLMSGLQIFNAHSSLSWGAATDFEHPFLSFSAKENDNGDVTAGETTLFGHTFDTTGLFGASRGSDGEMEERGFPSWATLPAEQDLAMGRRWHFFFAWLLVINGLVYVANLVAARHFRDLWPALPTSARSRERCAITPLLRFPKGKEALHYNVLQKLAYLSVVVAFPMLVLAGLTMSPAMDVSVSLAACDLPRTPVGADSPFRAGRLSRCLRRGASGDGARVRRLQQHAVHDHRPLPHRGGRAMKPRLSAQPSHLLEALRPAASCRLPDAASNRARPA